MTDFIKDLLLEIKDTVPELHPHAGAELPAEAFLGTIWMVSAGTVIEFYSYIDPAYCHDPMYVTEEVNIITVTFHKLSRGDKIHIRHHEDFNMYDRDIYHALIEKLQHSGFKIMLSN